MRPSETPGNHHQGDVVAFWETMEWDLIIAHPPCTNLAVSGARWWKEKGAKVQLDALNFFQACLDAPAHRVCVENPIGLPSTAICPPSQIIQPWQFGHGETKATCLWLKNLDTLKPTDIVIGREARIHMMPPGPEREREREKQDVQWNCKCHGHAVGRPNMAQ
jgi:hypothetical protein